MSSVFNFSNKKGHKKNNEVDCSDKSRGIKNKSAHKDSIYISSETRLDIMDGIMNYIRKNGRPISMKDYVAMAIKDFNSRQR